MFSTKKIPVKQLQLNIFSTCLEGEHTKLVFFEFTIIFNTIADKKIKKRNFLVKHQDGVKCHGNISN